MDYSNIADAGAGRETKGGQMNHFENAKQIAELIASGQVPLIKPHLIDAWVKSMLAGLKGN